MKLPQSTIDNYFSKLEKFINQLPLIEKGKEYIKFDSFCKFYDEPVQSEHGSPTYGIQTEWQLKRFIDQFKSNLKELRLKVVTEWTGELDKYEDSEAVAIINKQLYRLKRRELLSEIGGKGLDDWQQWLTRYLINEKQIRANNFKNTTIQYNNPKTQNSMNVDYFKIVIDGYLNPYHSKNLTAYFVAQSNKIERDEFITPDIFYKNCFSVVDELSAQLKKELIEMNEDEYFDEDGNEFKHSIDGISINLNVLTNGLYKYDLFQSDLFIIKHEIEKAKNQNNKTVKTQQFETPLTDTQRGKLYDLLVNGGYIAPETNKEGFIWVFGGKSDDYESFQIQWLKNQNLAVYLVDCLCFDKNLRIQSNYLSKAEKIFSINNPRQIRKGYENNNTGKPNGYRQIDIILEEAKK